MDNVEFWILGMLLIYLHGMWMRTSQLPAARNLFATNMMAIPATAFYWIGGWIAAGLTLVGWIILIVLYYKADKRRFSSKGS